MYHNFPFLSIACKFFWLAERRKIAARSNFLQFFLQGESRMIKRKKRFALSLSATIQEYKYQVFLSSRAALRNLFCRGFLKKRRNTINSKQERINCKRFSIKLTGIFIHASRYSDSINKLFWSVLIASPQPKKLKNLMKSLDKWPDYRYNSV